MKTYLFINTFYGIFPSIALINARYEKDAIRKLIKLMNEQVEVGWTEKWRAKNSVSIYNPNIYNRIKLGMKPNASPVHTFGIYFLPENVLDYFSEFFKYRTEKQMKKVKKVLKEIAGDENEKTK